MPTGSQLTERRVALQGRGTTLVREAAGPASAPTLVLLHGLGATGGLNWRPAFDPLSRSFRVVAIDPPRTRAGNTDSIALPPR